MNFLVGEVVPKIDLLDNEVETRTNQLQQTMNYPEVFRRGGWTTIQHRFSGALDFNRSWIDCAKGFGEVGGEFWFGLEKLHHTVRERKHELLVVLEGFDGVMKYAHYSDFSIGNGTEGYMIKRLGRYSGTAGDSLRRQKRARFSTYDKPQMGRLNRNCVDLHKGPWWCKFRYSQSNVVFNRLERVSRMHRACSCTANGCTGIALRVCNVRETAPAVFSDPPMIDAHQLEDSDRCAHSSTPEHPTVSGATECAAFDNIGNAAALASRGVGLNSIGRIHAKAVEPSGKPFDKVVHGRNKKTRAPLAGNVRHGFSLGVT
ncbi:AGAP012000-PA-like protein [Anopheles sinensis]|uniref:AGAP012000-PA-like protein n=1 Tax=Anopheles sinensis TaxID=74873 RepID=A0A084W6B4_ANOSI|nr:AGAP012000-PA-like protein [Anopheles sinensis]